LTAIDLTVYNNAGCVCGFSRFLTGETMESIDNAYNCPNYKSMEASKLSPAFLFALSFSLALPLPLPLVPLVPLALSPLPALRSFSVVGKTVRTHRVSSQAFRGAGTPQALAIIETAMEHLAYELGMDASDLRVTGWRRRNTERRGEERRGEERRGEERRGEERRGEERRGEERRGEERRGKRSGSLGRPSLV
jgi:hypothetical protein